MEERRLELHISRGVILTNQELNLVTEGLGGTLVYRLIRRLNLTRSVFIGLVNLTIIVIGRLVIAALLFIRGLFRRSFVVNRSSRSRSNLGFKVIKSIVDTPKGGSHILA
jgi:hypothetical protein